MDVYTQAYCDAMKAKWQAEGLREAADALDAIQTKVGTSAEELAARYDPALWLHVRADDLAP